MNPETQSNNVMTTPKEKFSFDIFNLACKCIQEGDHTNRYTNFKREFDALYLERIIPNQSGQITPTEEAAYTALLSIGYSITEAIKIIANVKK